KLLCMVVMELRYSVAVLFITTGMSGVPMIKVSPSQSVTFKMQASGMLMLFLRRQLMFVRKTVPASVSFVLTVMSPEAGCMVSLLQTHVSRESDPFGHG